jgi:hypothetical protein
MAKDLSNYMAKMEKVMEERKKKLKKGPNVIHLSYLSQHVSPTELSELEVQTEILGLQLSSLDNSGIPYNSISSLSSDIMLMLNDPGVVGALTTGLVGSALYDGIKALVLKIAALVKRRPTVIITSDTVMERPSSFHILIKLNKEQQIELKTENLDAQQLGIALNRVCEITTNLTEHSTSLMEFDSEKQKWEPIKVDIDYLKRPQQYDRIISLNDYLDELKNKKNL